MYKTTGKRSTRKSKKYTSKNSKKSFKKGGSPTWLDLKKRLYDTQHRQWNNENELLDLATHLRSGTFGTIDNIVDDDWNRTLLHIACSKLYTQLVKYLLEQGRTSQCI